MTVLKFRPLNTSLRALSRELALAGDALPSLMLKRAERVREIDADKAELRSKVRELKTLDSAIRLFDPDFVPPKG